MPSRSRHGTSPTGYYHSGYNDVPRHIPRMPEHASFSSPSLADGPDEMSNFSLSSHDQFPSRDISTWIDSGNFFPDQDDDLSCLGHPFSRLSAADGADSTYPPEMMLSSCTLDISPSYGPLANNVSMRSVSYAPEQCYPEMPVVNLGAFNSSMQGNAQAMSPTVAMCQSDSWAYGYPSPPLTNSSTDETILATTLQLPASALSPVDRTCVPMELSPDVTICEPLGPSPLQRYR